MDKSVDVLKREALAAVLSAAREMLRQVVVPAATGKVENLSALEAAYVELSGAMERWDEALEDERARFVQELWVGRPLLVCRCNGTEEKAPSASMQSVLDAFTCRCAVPVPGELDVCRVCGSFVPDVPAQEAA